MMPTSWNCFEPVADVQQIVDRVLERDPELDTLLEIAPGKKLHGHVTVFIGEALVVDLYHV